ncbi:hypothetical protein [Streptomyces sp. NPDC004134]|uniref:hypothetical protein n=1 Tax=Streptomyces sp. NPDC004134 TaxID=3364691 RepID=UPI0036BFE9FA
MADPGGRAAADEPRSPWLRTGFVLAAAFLGFVAVVGGAAVVTSDTPGGSGTDGAAADAPPSGGREGGAVPPARGGGAGGTCPELADARQDIPTAAPRGTTWSLYEGVALPASEQAGPAVADADVARCYARTPVGALLATSQISVRYLAARDWRKVTRTQTVGPGRDAYLAERAEAEESAPPTGPEGGAHGQIAGFRFVTYTGTTAVIQTVWRFPDGRMQAATTTVLWQEGDWRLEYPAAPAAATPVDSLAGYAEWGGV